VTSITVSLGGLVLHRPAMQTAGEGMVVKSTKLYALTDQACIEIIEGIKARIPEENLRSGAITGIGPVFNGAEADMTCVINLRGGGLKVAVDIDDGTLLAQVSKAISAGKPASRVRPGLAKLPAYKESLNPRPYRHSGPIMGGDPIWHNEAGHWGTIAFAVASKSTIEIEDYAFAGKLLTASHVVNFKAGRKSVSVTDYANAMMRTWEKPPKNDGQQWMDLAAVKIDDDLIDHVLVAPLEVRGLGVIQGVASAKPGIRVFKSGATTGVTAGTDLGPALRDLVEGDDIHKMHWVRVVSGDFADYGDSGAAVLDADRCIVGIIVSGQPGSIDETYYIAAAADDSATKMSTFKITGFN
jgi:hypothetical protein